MPAFRKKPIVIEARQLYWVELDVPEAIELSYDWRLTVAMRGCWGREL